MISRKMQAMFPKILISFLLIVRASSELFYDDGTYLNFTKTDVHFRNYFNPLFNESLNFLEFLSTNDKINSNCRSSLKRWMDGLERSEKWAMKFLESSGRTVNGKLLGRNSNFGSYDYCVEFRRDLKQKIDFDGKYCLVSVQTKDSLEFKKFEAYKNYQTGLSDRSKRLVQFNLGNAHGICMPSTCKIEQLASVFNKRFESYGFSILAPRKCTTISEPEPITQLQLISFAILSTFVILCFLSFFIENDFLSNFSLVENYKIIYDNNPVYDDSNSAEESSILHGIKAFLVILSTAVHCCVIYTIFLVFPTNSIRENSAPYETPLKLDTILFIAFKNFYSKLQLIADQLFFVGGFFAMYAWFTILKKKKMRLGFLSYFIGRYIRIAITVVPVILIYLVLPVFDNLGGPLYSDLTNHFADNCKEKFHYFFLLITHQQSPMDMCLIPAWFFNIDFIIYGVNYLLIFYLILKPRIGFILLILQMMLFSFLTVFTFEMNRVPIFYSFIDDYKTYDMTGFDNLYFNSYSHYNTYVLGVLCAYMVKNKIKFKILSNLLVRLCIWAILTMMVISVYLYPYVLARTESTPSQIMKFLYPVFDKIFISLFLFWIFYSVLSGYSTWYKPMLCLKIWVPLSRLSFSLIVSQFVYLGFSYPTTRTFNSINLITYLKEFSAALLGSFMIANLIFLFYEGPMISITKKYLGLKARHEKIAKLIKIEELNKPDDKNIVELKTIS